MPDSNAATSSPAPAGPPTQSGLRSPPAYLFALGHQPLPTTVTVEHAGRSRTYYFAKLFKHDFFAATGLYQEEGFADRDVEAPGGGGAVLKIQRTYHFWGLPMRWLGRRIARHEIAILESLQGVPGVPDFLGPYGPTGFLHAYVPGAPLEPTAALTPVFFEQLHDLLAAIHARHIAYVDTNKRENILLGTDGRPWLIDFQISYRARRGPRANLLVRWTLARLQRADWYHYYKHKTRLLPAACTPEDFTAAQRRGFLHGLHRVIARPIIQVRRKFLSRYKLEKVK
ncbi:MAG: hypothetical protein WCI73_02450 [Phycisphaerae bacterium]